MNVFISYAHQDRVFAKELAALVQALGAKVLSDDTALKPGQSIEQRLREALQASDGIVLVLPEPGTARANNAFFEAGAARALGKPVVVVLPRPEASRLAELPPDVYGRAVFNGAELAPEALAEGIISALKAA